MTITVIGHLCIDEIHTSHSEADGYTPKEDFGGIYYSLVTAAVLVGQKDVIHPVFGVGEKEFEEVKTRLGEFPNIDLSGIYRFEGATNRVRVFAENGNGGRTECSMHIAAPIPYAKIKPYLDADGILINMASGFDLTLETMDSIRMAVRDARTPIHFDFHSLTLGIDTDSRRFRRPLADWRRWCFMLNSIQMTEEETHGLSAEHYDEPTLINQLMPLMVNALIITRGAKGATAILQENKKLTRHDFEGVSFGPTIDTSGCGDVFGAAFFTDFLQHKIYRSAAEYANQAAGIKATVSGASAIPMIAEKLKSASIAH